MSKVSDAAAAAAERRRQEQLRREAEARAEAARQRAIAAAKAKAAAAAKAKAKPKIARDEMSVGKGRALREGSRKLLATGVEQTGAPAFVRSPPAAAATGKAPQPSAPVRPQAGTASTGTVTPGSANTAPTPLQRAVDRVQAAAERPPAAGARSLREEAEQLTEPTQVDALINATRPQLTAIADALGDRIRDRNDDSTTRDSLEALATVSDLASSAGVETIANELASALEDAVPFDGGQDLFKFDDTLRDLAEDGKGVALTTVLADKVFGHLEVAGNNLLDVSTRGIEELNSRYEDAQATYATEEQQLASDLATFGPGMTAEQRTAYTEAFWDDPDHKPALDALNAADANLANTVDHAHAALTANAATGDDDSAKALLDSLENLATSPTHADDALRYVAELNSSTDENLIAHLEEQSGDDDLQTRLENKVVAPALARAQGEAMAAVADGDAGALDRLQGDLRAFKGEVKNFTRLASAIGGLDETLEALRRNPTQFRLDQLTNGFADKSPLGKALAVFGVVSAIHRAGQNTELSFDALQEDLGAIRGGVQLGIGILNTVARGSALASDAAEFGAKFLPGVGLVIDAIELGQGINELREDPNAGEFIEVLGSGISIVGDLAGLVPFLGTLPDGLLTAVGGVVSSVGSALDGIITGDQEREELENERRELLEAAGVPAGSAQLLMGTDTQVLRGMGALGLDRQDFLIQLRRFEEADQSDTPEAIASLQAVGALGLQGPQAIEFMREFREIGAANPDAVFGILGPLGEIEGHILAFDLNEQGAGNEDYDVEEQTGLLNDALQNVRDNLGPFAHLFNRVGFEGKEAADINTALFLAQAQGAITGG